MKGDRLAMKPLEMLDLRLASDLRELTRHGTPVFPCAGYDEDPGNYLAGCIPWHWHDELEIVLVTEGETCVLCGETEYCIRAGDAIFVNSNVLHKLQRKRNSERCRINSLLFTSEFVSGFPQSIVQQRYILPLTKCVSLADIFLDHTVFWQHDAIRHFQNAFAAFGSDVFGYEILVQTELMRTMHEIVFNLQEHITENDLVQNRDSIRIKQMLGFIHAHFSDPLTVAQIASASAVSESECYRCFRKVLDVSPIDYLLQYRIRAAAGMLAGTDMSVSDVCFACGFHSPSYFAKVFRQALLYSPRSYRLMQRSSSGSMIRSPDEQTRPENTRMKDFM
jgi:AraC-like DNA-binding protein/mannose-6-phosphate isomerase-like protein (cupin superfamily)